MNKLYNRQQNLIGHELAGDKFNNILDLFNKDCEVLSSKVGLLGIDSDTDKYFIDLVNKYKLPGLYIQNNKIYLSGTNSLWEYKPLSMSTKFWECEADELNLEYFDTSNTTHFNGTFNHSKINKLDLRTFNTSKAISMNTMFTECTTSEINLESFDTSNVINMVSMFRKFSTQSLNLSSFNTSKVTNMMNMFSESRISNLDISNFYINDTTNISNMFFRCNIEHIKISKEAFDMLIKKGAAGASINNFRWICEVV